MELKRRLSRKVMTFQLLMSMRVLGYSLSSLDTNPLLTHDWDI